MLLKSGWNNSHIPVLLLKQEYEIIFRKKKSGIYLIRQQLIIIPQIFAEICGPVNPLRWIGCVKYLVSDKMWTFPQPLLILLYWTSAFLLFSFSIHVVFLFNAPILLLLAEVSFFLLGNQKVSNLFFLYRYVLQCFT